MRRWIRQTRFGSKRLAAGVWLALLGTEVLIAQRALPARYPISEAAIAGVLRARGLDVEPTQIRLPMQISSPSASPGLEIVSAQRFGGVRVRLRLRCQKVSECLPFYVVLNLRSESELQLFVPGSNAPAMSSGQPFAAAAQREISWPVSAQARGGAVSLPVAPATGVHVGEHITLLIQDGHMQIQLPALAIDTGAPGSEVRVCSEDHKKTFRGFVLDANTVRGEIE